MTTVETPVTDAGWRGPDGSGLRADTPHTLTDGVRRWPVVDGIPWLRPGRDELREVAVAALDAGDPGGATVSLLADADDWWDGPAPPPHRLRAALQARTLTEAVDLLGLGRVGTYFRHRWSDPSWLAVLALTAAHPPPVVRWWTWPAAPGTCCDTSPSTGTPTSPAWTSSSPSCGWPAASCCRPPRRSRWSAPT